MCFCYQKYETSTMPNTLKLILAKEVSLQNVIGLEAFGRRIITSTLHGQWTWNAVKQFSLRFFFFVFVFLFVFVLYCSFEEITLWN